MNRAGVTIAIWRIADYVAFCDSWLESAEADAVVSIDGAYGALDEEPNPEGAAA